MNETGNDMNKRPETAPSKIGMLIDDDELRRRYPDDAELVIDQLDRDPKTQLNETVWHGKRYRPAVEAKLKEMGRA